MERKLDIINAKLNLVIDLLENPITNNSTYMDTSIPRRNRRTNTTNNLFHSNPLQSQYRVPSFDPPNPTNPVIGDTLEFTFTNPSNSTTNNLFSTLLGLGPRTNEENSANTGLSLETIMNTTLLYVNSTPGQTCSICQDTLEDNAIVRKINHCQHVFHSACLENWLLNHSTCPTCRHNLDEQHLNA